MEEPAQSEFEIFNGRSWRVGRRQLGPFVEGKRSIYRCDSDVGSGLAPAEIR